MTKLCHHLPNLRAILSTLTNPVVSLSRLRVSNTTTNTQTLPVNNPTISHHANSKEPNAPLHHINNKPSALSFGHPSLHIHPPTIKVNLRDHRLLTSCDHFAQRTHNGHNTIPITDDHRFRHKAHPTNLSETIDHRFDLHITQTNILPQMDPPTTICALHPTLSPLSAKTVDASATTHAAVPTLRNLCKTFVPPTHNHQTMKTQLLAINNVLTLLLPTLTASINLPPPSFQGILS
jgi:hypothetical protein